MRRILLLGRFCGCKVVRIMGKVWGGEDILVEGALNVRNRPVSLPSGCRVEGKKDITSY